METIQTALQKLISSLFDGDEVVELTRTEPEFGDFSTNIAMKMSKRLGQNPRTIAEKLIPEIQKIPGVKEVTVAGPGFINLRLNDDVIAAMLVSATSTPQSLAGKVIVAEYSDPNPFKILHAGHLYTSVVGDAIANIMQDAGGEVHRVNFGGDVGLHVGKTMWAMIKTLGSDNPSTLNAFKTVEQRTTLLADSYIAGTAAYEDDDHAKEEIITLNKAVYQVHTQKDHESNLAKIYWTTRTWSYDYFDNFYDRIGTTFEKYYPESEVADLGLKVVKDHMQPGIFEESDGAIVFKGEPFGLHTRVFINQQGLPTYEAKDVGLIFTKKHEYNFDISVVITGNEQEQYMKVVLKAIEQFDPEIVSQTKHLTHGLVKLKGGVKMSSRKGNILRATDILDEANAANVKVSGKTDERVTLGAVKYSFLKIRTGGDIIYDPAESVATEGNSGPYLQYAHARARSIVAKSTSDIEKSISELEPGERTLAVKLTEFGEVVGQAAESLTPHLVCTYLYELSQEFNRFYEHNRVIDDPREAERLYLVNVYASILKKGLELLGIHAPETM
ncbi:MAG: arginine--tRNA ligase [Candidatus Saccharibacteria bacterium]|nr:arginine--tRNA ligase [Candidatus Saccharibacteria bacterium]